MWYLYLHQKNKLSEAEILTSDSPMLFPIIKINIPSAMPMDREFLKQVPLKSVTSQTS
jgi:hypothetical protein